MTASPSAAPAGGLPPSPSDPATPPLRIAVMGAGAVGCYFGALLADRKSVV